MILALCLLLGTATPAAHERAIAVLPMETSALDPAGASALEQEVRAAVVAVVGESGLIPADSQRAKLAGSHLAPAEAARKLSATHVLTSTTRKMEGALAVVWSLVAAEGNTVGSARLVGFTPAEVRSEARPKIEKMLRESFGLAAPNAAATPAGILRIPGAPKAEQTTAPGPVIPAAPLVPQEPARPESMEALIRETVAEVEEVRGLKRQSPLKVLLLDDELFGKALRTKAEQELTAKAVAKE